MDPKENPSKSIGYLEKTKYPLFRESMYEKKGVEIGHENSRFWKTEDKTDKRGRIS